MDFIEAYCLNLSEKYLNDYKEASRVIIAGERDFEDYEYLCEKLNGLFFNPTTFIKSRTIKIISGMAKVQISLPSVMRMNIN